MGWFLEGTEPRDACHLHFDGWEESAPSETETEISESPVTWEDREERKDKEPWWFSRFLPWP